MAPPQGKRRAVQGTVVATVLVLLCVLYLVSHQDEASMAPRHKDGQVTDHGDAPQPDARTDDLADIPEDVVDAPQPSQKRTVLTFHSWFHHVLITTFGRVIVEAVYDPDMFNQLGRMRGGEGGTWPNRDLFVFTTFAQFPKTPTHFYNISNLLWWNKRLTSVAISKLSRDSEIDRLYRRVASDPNPLKLHLLEKTIVRALSAQVQYFHTVLQLGVDVDLSDENVVKVLRGFASEHRGLDPLVLLSGWITSVTTIGQINELFASPEKLREVIADRLSKSKRLDEESAWVVRPAQPLFPLRYDDVPYNRANPLNGKFWNMIRPTAGCSSIVRLCEVADGCRLLCNPEYFLHAGRSRRSAVHPTTPYHHRFIGMGCNNDYEWENSIVSLFAGASNLSNDTTHRIGWFTAMDCSLTVAHGRRQWKVPQSLQQSAVGFGAVSLCADGNKTGPNIITLREVKAFQITAEQGWSEPTTSQPIIRHKAHADAIAASSQRPGVDHLQYTMVPRRVDSQEAPAPPRWFDGVSILKMDIEGFEWNVVPTWLEDELRSVGTTVPHAVSKGSTAPIDFEAAAPEYFSVSLLALEFHRIGHKQLYGAVSNGALRAHWLLLHIYALGFILVGHEKNEMDQCCFEHAYVHVRHFVRSEMWMVLRDEL